MCGSMLSRGRPKLLALSLLALTAGAAHAQLSGAIFTTLPDGQTVNGNIYDDIQKVYLNGGPQNMNAAGLPDGIYFFQVTNPNGQVLLSTTTAMNRLEKVTGGRFAGRCNASGTLLSNPVSPHPNGPKNLNQGGIPCQLYPFNITPNNGGEYKAWLMLMKLDSGSKIYATPASDGLHVNFLHRYAKTDNFKIKPPKHPPQGFLFGRKWFDLNNNGALDPNEPPIENFAIKLTLNNNQVVYVLTAPDGSWQYPPEGQPGLPGGTTYKVSEVLPPDAEYPILGISDACPHWIQTAPGTSNDTTENRGYSGTISGDVLHLDFGNTQAMTVSGTKFYDRNMNGTQDAGEPSIANWPLTVTITLPGEQPVTTTIYTDAYGNYTIPNLVIGAHYVVSEVLGGGTWLQTGPAGNNYTGDVVVGNGPFTVSYCLPDLPNQNFGNIQQARLKGLKFYDTNGDGKEEAGEPGIQNFKIEIDYVKPNGVGGTDIEYTDASGKWHSILLPDGTTYTVKEILPPTGGWIQTFPSPGGTYSGTITGPAVTITTGYTIPDVTGLDFGNRVPPPGNAKTKGFWHNQNGYAAMNDGGTIVPELTMLNGLCLVRLDGSPADFNTANPSAGFTDFSAWITSDSNGSNMACQLSTQLAAMELNVEAGYVSSSQLIFAPGTLSANYLGVATLSDLMAEANASVCANPNTTASGPARTAQTALEQALDNGNNNLNWLGVPIIIVSPY